MQWRYAKTCQNKRKTIIEDDDDEEENRNQPLNPPVTRRGIIIPN